MRKFGGHLVGETPVVNNLQKEPDAFQQYDDIVKKHLEDGIIEKSNNSKEYLQRDDVVTHYLPHHMVKSANKMRVVFEGNAKKSSF